MPRGASQYQLSFEVSPIILTNGIALPGGSLPIVSITDSANFSGGLLSGGNNIDLDEVFATYVPLTGASLIDQDIATYPFANQVVAANAVIQNPLHISFKMIVPVREASGYVAKSAIMTSLKSALDQHNILGGTYTLATPSYIYTNCLLRSFRDVSSGQSKQAQVEWQLDFDQTLLTEDQAAQSLNNLMNKITAGTRFNGPPTWSGLEPTIGLVPSLAGPGLIPAAQQGSAANASSPQTPFITSPQ